MSFETSYWLSHVLAGTNERDNLMRLLVLAQKKPQHCRCG